MERLALAVLLVSFTGLAGCDALILQGRDGTPTVVEDSSLKCAVDASNDASNNVVPNFAKSDCMLENWVAFGLASQRGDHQWRTDMLGRTEGYAPEQRLARAVVQAWGSVSQWREASGVLKSDLESAPEELQPLMRYWRNELEGRLALQGRVGYNDDEVAQLRKENQELAKKLEALTAIEQNINLRQQVE
ncbi:hypothetical protein E4T21_16945 [Halomonas binhaiensis]|uniref:Uncharacterized protein n=2 Tax=Halomonas binhaiensis TaxID=2562282 RepID=A0A5C1NNY2_9GAMM|nr:hypothetical protein E4T21_16945 [Halomonas binhaiensis]